VRSVVSKRERNHIFNAANAAELYAMGVRVECLEANVRFAEIKSTGRTKLIKDPLK
jgi:hypothetical protein